MFFLPFFFFEVASCHVFAHKRFSLLAADPVHWVRDGLEAVRPHCQGWTTERSKVNIRQHLHDPENCLLMWLIALKQRVRLVSRKS